MKNIKTYESFFKKQEYNNGDYVLIMDSNSEKHFAKIIRYSQVAESYLMYIYDFNSERWMGYNRIIRKMTNKEIEKLETHLSIKKYNL